MSDGTYFGVGRNEILTLHSKMESKQKSSIADFFMLNIIFLHHQSVIRGLNVPGFSWKIILVSDGKYFGTAV